MVGGKIIKLKNKFSSNNQKLALSVQNLTRREKKSIWSFTKKNKFFVEIWRNTWNSWYSRKWSS